jgi:hypothetical protein
MEQLKFIAVWVALVFLVGGFIVGLWFVWVR